MRSKLLVGLAAGAATFGGAGVARASPSLANTCFDVGFACLNAGPAGNMPGTCEAATCVDLLDASYACGVCEPGDAGGLVGVDGGAHGAPDDAGSSTTSEPDGALPAVDAASSDGATPDASTPDAADEADAYAFDSASPPGSEPSEGDAGASSTSDAPDAGASSPTMPGCSTGAARPVTSGGALGIALCVAALGRARRRRVGGSPRPG